jgi:hypothetical protein
METAVQSDIPDQPQYGWIGWILRQERYVLTAGGIASLAIVYWLIHTMNVPAASFRAGAILQQPHAMVAMGVVWIAFGLSCAVATIIASRCHYDAGVTCAAIGLAGFSSRFGPSRFILFQASGKGVYLTLAVELILLFIPIALAWMLLHRMSTSGALPAESLLDETEADEPLDQKFLAGVAQALVMTILMMLMCQTDAKRQTMASVAISAYLGALAAHHFIATRPSIWYWMGPLLVGIIGYLGQAFTGGADWTIGDPRGFFAPLARPHPLDYASLGVAGAMLGYWTSQRWQHQRAEMEMENA